MVQLQPFTWDPLTGTGQHGGSDEVTPARGFQKKVARLLDGWGVEFSRNLHPQNIAGLVTVAGHEPDQLPDVKIGGTYAHYFNGYV